MKAKRESRKPQDRRRRVLEIRQLVRQLGTPPKLKCIRTGIHALDLMLGNGIPLGRVVEIFGDESTGKSLLAWEIAKAWQKKGGMVVCFDVEATTPRKWIKRLGVKMNRLIWRKPQHFEELENDFFAIHTALKKAQPDLKILWIHDTIAATSSLKEWDWDRKAKKLVPRQNGQPGVQALAMSKFLKHITPYLSEGDSTYLAINQVREKIGILFGEKTTTPGGRALRFYSSIRVALNRGKRVESKKTGKPVGVICNVFIKKNKCAEPFRKAPLKILWRTGFDTYAGLSEVLEDAGRVKKAKMGRYKLGKSLFRPRDIEKVIEGKPELVRAWY